MAEFEDRSVDWDEDTTQAELGQVNLDDGTRSKITHSEFLGCGIIGSVKGVHYGSWKNQPACLVLMQFNFRSKNGFLRLKRAELHISFTKDANKAPEAEQPTLCLFSPRTVYGAPQPEKRMFTFEVALPTSISVGPVSSGPSISVTRESEYTKEHRLKISGQQWADRRSGAMHQVIWTMQEADKMGYGIPDVLNVGVIVANNGPFRATVEVTATTGANIPIFCPPWSKDDPLLFDAVTTKGSAPSTLKFDELCDTDWSALVPYYHEWQLIHILIGPSNGAIILAQCAAPKIPAVLPCNRDRKN